jgi:large subunit ribosomal protein L10
VPTEAKVKAVDDLKESLEGVKTVVLTEYRGLTVQQLSDLRKQLRAVSAQYKVVKNRLAKIAVGPTGLEALHKHLTGPTGMVVSREDPVAVAKALQTFTRSNQALIVKVGYVDGQVLEPAGVKALADLPSREALRSQLVGALQGPLAQLVGLLTAPQRELAYILDQRGSASRDNASGEASGEMTQKQAGAGAAAESNGNA